MRSLWAPAAVRRLVLAAMRSARRCGQLALTASIAVLIVAGVGRSRADVIYSFDGTLPFGNGSATFSYTSPSFGVSAPNIACSISLNPTGPCTATLTTISPSVIVLYTASILGFQFANFPVDFMFQNNPITSAGIYNTIPGSDGTGTLTVTGSVGGGGGPGGGGGGGGPTCASMLTGALHPLASGPVMNATFTPTGGTLADAEGACGVKGFNWQQWVDVLPAPSFVSAASHVGVPLTAPPPFLDPPPGGYFPIPLIATCNGRAVPHIGNGGEDSNPFYWGPNELIANTTSTTLSFQDIPADPCLSGQQDLEFTTTLVGVDASGNPVALPVTDTWNWVSDFDGTAGQAFTLKNTIPVDPGSGTGGVAIISINGVRVPEPSALALLGFGIGGIGFYRRRKAMS
jgi:PEP-CTERM motif